VSKLSLPLKQGLREPADEAALSRIWQGIDARFPRPRWRRRIELVAAPLALAAVAAVVVFLRHDPGPLRLTSGAAITAIDAPAAGAGISLSDGSYIALGGGARLEPLESSGSTFIAIVARGTASFDVRPGGPRRWQIECGLATVEVVGTHFDVERSAGRLRVAVARGQVLVRGERVPDRVRRLAAGEALEITDATAAAAEPKAADHAEAGDSEPAAAAPELDRAPAGGSPAPASAWRDLARRGQHREAFAALGAQGLRREARRLGVTDLFALADVARLSGHPADAVAPLERIVTNFASDAQAPLAAFALGRLELDSLARPARAVAALNKALALGAPQSLREDVRARLVEAPVRANDQAAARSASDAYRREFPDGRHTKAIEALVSKP
jgi:transmembrane sensor